MQLGGERDQRGPRGEVRPEQNDATDLAAPDPPEQVRRWRGAFHPDDELLADELRQRRLGCTHDLGRGRDCHEQ